MIRKVRIILIFGFAILASNILVNGPAFAQESWIYPNISISETYDDNIFLTQKDRRIDWITGISPSIEIRPKLAKHEVMVDYIGDFNFFAHYSDQDNYNHMTHAKAKLNFNKWNIDLKNRFKWFSERSGSEDINRVPRTQDHASIHATYEFPKVDVTGGYLFKYEDYRTDDAIGSFNNQSLTYQDLDRVNNMGEFELAAKVWPKTSILFSGDYGAITHRTGKKSDSTYFDLLIGLRGQPTSKIEVEANIGYRDQNYENYSDDFSGVVFNGSVILSFNPRNVMRFDFLRTTNETIYKENVYYESTFFAAQYKHGFTDRIDGDIFYTYQSDYYPTITTDDNKTRNREDTIWTAGGGVSYTMPVGVKIALKYIYLLRDSVFSIYDYKDNRVILSVSSDF